MSRLRLSLHATRSSILLLFAVLPCCGAAASAILFVRAPDSLLPLIGVPLLVACVGAVMAPVRWRGQRSRLATFAGVLLATGVLLIVALVAAVVVLAPGSFDN